MASVDGRYGGVVEIKGEVYFANKYNEKDELIANLQKASVEIDVEQVVAGKFSATLGGYRELTAYQTFVAPYMTVKYLTTDDPLGTGGYMSEVVLREQIGLFALLPMTRDFDGGSVTQSLVANDMMWLVSQRYAYGAITLPKGTGVISYIRERLDILDFRHSIQASGATISKEMTWSEGTSWITVFNDLLDAIGYYHLWADRFGRIISRPLRLINQVSAQTSFSTEWGDIGKHVVLEPDPEWVKNDVIVYGNNPGDAPISARVTNTDRDSPTSIYGLRSDDTSEPIYLTLTESDSSIESQSVALARAKKLLEERTSMFYSLQVETVPYPGLQIREPIDLTIVSDFGEQIADGKWWWDHLTVGFSHDDGAMKLRCNRLLPFETEES